MGLSVALLLFHIPRSFYFFYIKNMAYILALFAGTFISLALGLPTSPSQLDTEQLFSKRDTVCYPENMENYVVSAFSPDVSEG